LLATATGAISRSVLPCLILPFAGGVRAVAIFVVRHLAAIATRLVAASLVTALLFARLPGLLAARLVAAL
jgi:hypothetical protein